jgi:hypothetical protein
LFATHCSSNPPTEAGQLLREPGRDVAVLGGRPVTRAREELIRQPGDPLWRIRGQVIPAEAHSKPLLLQLLRAYVDDPVLGSSAIKAIKQLTGEPS